jgi:hypothetical protein
MSLKQPSASAMEFRSLSSSFAEITTVRNYGPSPSFSKIHQKVLQCCLLGKNSRTYYVDLRTPGIEM